MNPLVKKVLKWNSRSGILTTFLAGSALLVAGLQAGQFDVKFFAYGIVILLVNSAINSLDYYNQETKSNVKGKNIR